MGQTPIYALPWPEPTDPADGPLGFENLAVATEAAISSPPPGTTLPASPRDGQVARIRVTGAAPTSSVVWSFIYLASLTAPYRWAFLGGDPIRTFSTFGGPFGNIMPTGEFWPNTQITLPSIAGVWRIRGQAFAYAGAPGGVGYLGMTSKPAQPLAPPSGATSDTDATYSPTIGVGGYQGMTVPLYWYPTLPAGSKISWWGAGAGANALNGGPPTWIEATPLYFST
jgi:hypothetical protein